MNKHERIFQVNLEQLSLDLERLHRPNAACINKMEQSIKRQGLITPIVVYQKDTKYMLIDGFKRVRACKNMGWKSLSAVDIQADNHQAKAMVYLMNQTGSFSTIQEALLIKELVEYDGLSQKEVSILLDRHKSWVSRRLEMIRNLQDEVIDSFLMGLIPPGVGPSLARIPLCNQGDFVVAIQKDQLTPNEIHQLVDIFCKTNDPGIKNSILKSPRQSLSFIKKESKKLSWISKLQLMVSTIAMFEKELFNNRHIISDKGFNQLVERINQIKPILKEILPVMKKEGIWED